MTHLDRIERKARNRMIAWSVLAIAALPVVVIAVLGIFFAGQLVGLWLLSQWPGLALR